MDEKLVEDVSLVNVESVAESEAGSDSSSDAAVRFRSCRWRKAPENGSGECCAHRDVLPLTGVNGFDAEAWCPDCGFFKLRRTPRKREDFGFSY